ncbi:MAG TPA: hypothetical protein VIY51_07950 [Xanthobacteraceae bacterium]
MSDAIDQRPSFPPWFAGPLASTDEYLIDAAQRNVLFWDVMRQRKRPASQLAVGRPLDKAS